MEFVEKGVIKKQKSIYCDNCRLWIHKSCEGLIDGEFQKLVEEEDNIPWICLVCHIKHNAEVSPLDYYPNLNCQTSFTFTPLNPTFF